MNDLKDIVDNGTTYVTIPTPKGWRCERPNCPTDFLHTHGTYPSLTQKQYIFLRFNLGAGPKTPPQRLTEHEARTYIGTSVRNVERAMKKLKHGHEFRTRFATYRAQEI